MKTALLIIDMQKDFFTYGEEYKKHLDKACEYINAAIALFREKELPIICIQHLNPDEGLIPGNPGFETTDKLDVLPSDIYIHKSYGNSFNKTNLLEVLNEFKADTLIITGFCAENCILSTCRGALDHDLIPIILRDSLASSSAEAITFVEKINDLISYRALKTML